MHASVPWLQPDGLVEAVDDGTVLNYDIDI